MSIYDYSVKTISGDEQTLSNYKENVLLIVNTASECGFTPQLKQLEELYEQYKEQGFYVLGFPSNQFGNQEPLKDDEIVTFCEQNYGVSFPLFSKINVKGDDAHPLFKHLTSNAKGMLSNEIKWNFTKFLIDQEGNVIDRFAPQTKPERIASEVEKVLS